MNNKQLEKLFIKYHRELYIYALSLCRDHHKAQDLVSDTFFKALLSLDKNTPYIKYWLFKVCKNLFLDRVRKDKNYTAVDNLENILVTEKTPVDSIVDNENKKIIYQQIMKLNHSYREVIVLYYYCDFTLKEIAKASGLTEGAAKVMLYRARKNLKKLLEVNKGEL
ncbi:MAG: sigma-70 family RNA polymerase sigma factor [Tissierellia bacterium]|nr:sigma-70 family RNA polymerase sigma factor [Tissierellia bacterium]